MAFKLEQIEKIATHMAELTEKAEKTDDPELFQELKKMIDQWFEILVYHLMTLHLEPKILTKI